MRRPLLAVAVALAGVAPPAGAATTVLTNDTQPISAVAAGAPTAALVGCGRAIAVAARGGAMLARYPFSRCYGEPYSGAGPLARAGDRTAWVVRGGGFGGGWFLETSLVAAPRPGALAARLAHAVAPDDVGPEVRDLAADGDAFLWTEVVSEEDGDRETTVRRSPAIGSVATIVTLTGEARLLAVGQGRIAVLDGSARVQLLDAGGTPVRDLGGGPVRAAAITGGIVYVLRSRRIDRHTLDGEHLSSLPLRATSRETSRLAVHRGVAVYTTTLGVRAVRIASGRDVLVAVGPPPGAGTARGLVDATIDAGGVVWAVNDRCRDDNVCRGRVLRAPVPGR